nr:long chain acyl-CoA synthetase 6, peroxisomal-like [Ipomoea batatas]GMD81790.1 long chain acyl-CoA synthetase 6, peroxisomal-like [Ipomoea batatas]
MNAVKTSGVLRERMFNTAYNAKKHAIFAGLTKNFQECLYWIHGKSPSQMWDRLVFNKIKARLGGKVRIMVSGASPLSPDVMDFLRV